MMPGTGPSRRSGTRPMLRWFGSSDDPFGTVVCVVSVCVCVVCVCVWGGESMVVMMMMMMAAVGHLLSSIGPVI